MNGTRGNGTLNVFQMILWGMGGREFDKNYKVTLNDDKALPAWELLAELGQYCQADVGSNNWDEMNAVYKNGQCAMQYQRAALLAGNELADPPVAAEREAA